MKIQTVSYTEHVAFQFCHTSLDFSLKIWHVVNPETTKRKCYRNLVNCTLYNVDSCWAKNAGIYQWIIYIPNLLCLLVSVMRYIRITDIIPLDNPVRYILENIITYK